MAGSSAVAAIPSEGRQRDCRFLLAALLALLVVFPFLEEIARPLILVLPIAAVFVAGVAAADGRPADTRRALALAALQLAGTVASLAARGRQAAYLASVSMALLATVALMLYSTYCVLRYVLHARAITRDQIYAGICMYLMFGFAFGAIFYLVNILEPGSFTASKHNPDLMYFSFVTLATLGYGDITPATATARTLAVLEALAGMLYIAVFMARLVSLRSTGGDGP